MKILLTVHQFFPQYAAGTEVLTYSVAKALLARGHEVRVLTASPTETPMGDDERFDEYQYEDIHVYRFYHAYAPMGGQSSMVELSFDNHLAAGFFGEILGDFKPDIVHFFHLDRLGTGLIELAVQAGIPAFMTPTDFWSICPTGRLLLDDGALCSGPDRYSGNCVKHFAMNPKLGAVSRLAKYVPSLAVDVLVRLTQADRLPAYPHRIEVRATGSRLAKNTARLNQLSGIVSPNAFMTDKLVQYGISPNLITPLAFGINVPEASKDLERPKPRQPFRIGFIGTLIQHKGCHVLLEAFGLLPPGIAVLKIYGNPDEFPEYVGQLKQLAAGRDDIEFCGTFGNQMITEKLMDVDVLVVPSLWFENTPLVLYSAQAARCPVIASNFPGISEVIKHDVNGLLFEAGDSAGLATNLLQMIRVPGLAERLSAHSVKPNSTNTYVDRLLSLWSARSLSLGISSD